MLDNLVPSEQNNLQKWNSFTVKMAGDFQRRAKEGYSKS